MNNEITIDGVVYIKKEEEQKQSEPECPNCGEINPKCLTCSDRLSDFQRNNAEGIGVDFYCILYRRATNNSTAQRVHSCAVTKIV